MRTRPIEPRAEIHDLKIELVPSPAGSAPRTTAGQESIVGAVGALAGAIALIGAVVLIGSESSVDRRGYSMGEQADPIDQNPWSSQVASAPTMTVGPVDDLADGQGLTVSGTGFRPGTKISLTQCVLGLYESISNCYQARHLDLEIADDAGKLATVISARRYLATDGGVLDCAALSWGRCAIVVTAEEARTPGSSRFAGARQLRYADSPGSGGPKQTADHRAERHDPTPATSSRRSPPLDVSISRDAGLSDGDSVRVRILGGEPRARVRIELCDAEAPEDASCPALADHDLNSFGGGAFDIRVPRLTRSHDNSELVDCAAGCKLRLMADDSTTGLAIAFDETSEMLERATLSIEGDTLTPGRPVSVTGSGFMALSSFDAFICSRPIDRGERFWADPVNWCGWPPGGLWSAEPSMAPDGSFRATLMPPTTVELLSWSGPHNCLMQDCWLVVTTGRAPGTTPVGSVLLSFDQSAS